MSEPAQPPDAQDALPSWVVVAVTAVLTALLSVWAAFLVPLRIGTVPVPVSLLLLASMAVLGVLAGRAAGWRAALLLALVWTCVTLPLALIRREGDLVVQGIYGSTLVGTLYLFGGTVLWAAVTSAAHRRGRFEAAGATP